MRMMRIFGTGLLTVFLSSGLMSAANADFSGGMKLASHYAWQGGTESGDGEGGEIPVLQGSMYYNFASCYVGFWVSGTGEDYSGTEIDYETGCGGALTDTIGYSVDLLRFAYPGSGGANLTELRLKLSADLGLVSVWGRVGLPKFDEYTAGQEDRGNTSGQNRPQFGISVPFGESPFSVSATYGQDNKRPNGDDYDWYHVAINTSWNDFGISVFYSKRSERDQNIVDPLDEDGEPNITLALDGIFGASISRSF